MNSSDDHDDPTSFVKELIIGCKLSAVSLYSFLLGMNSGKYPENCVRTLSRVPYDERSRRLFPVGRVRTYLRNILWRLG